jgi:sugar/nucleoside kinase (ribokinase family)
VERIAITKGEKPIVFSDEDVDGTVEIANDCKILATLGAGDIFHGAFCYFLLSSGGNFQLALKKASAVATLSCKYLDTRSWASDPILQKIVATPD